MVEHGLVSNAGDHGRRAKFRSYPAGVVSEQTLRRLASLSIVFVCTGNTCRSPMAEAMCRSMLAARLKCSPNDLEDRGVVVSSAGISASMGGRAAPEAVAVMSELGIDLSHHASQQLNEQLIRHADVIWAMTRSHRQAILNLWPDASGRSAFAFGRRTRRARSDRRADRPISTLCGTNQSGVEHSIERLQV